MASPAVPRDDSRLKILIGCGFALALAALAVFGLVAWGLYWAVSPGRQLPTAIVVGPQTTGVVRFGDLAADPGATAFLATLMEETEKGDGGPDLPPWAKAWLSRSRADAIKQWLPREGTLSFERDPEGAVHPVAALNFRVYVRPIRALIERMADDRRVATRVRHGGETIVVFSGGTALCFVGGTLLLSDDAGLVRSVLDRAAAPGSPPPTLPAELTRLTGGWDSSGVMSQPETAGALVARVFDAGEAPDDLAPAGARFGIDAQPGDEVRAFLDLAFPSDADAEAAGPAVDAAFQDARRRAEAAGVRLRLGQRRQGARLVIDVEAGGLAAALGRHTAATSRERREHPPRER
jgi:hypothetical protein